MIPGLGPALYHGDEGYVPTMPEDEPEPCPCIFCGKHCEETCEDPEEALWT
jgi:hypothetical protein